MSDEAGDKKVRSKNYAEPVGLTVFASYKDREQEKVIEQMLSTLKFLQ